MVLLQKCTVGNKLRFQYCMTGETVVACSLPIQHPDLPLIAHAAPVTHPGIVSYRRGGDGDRTITDFRRRAQRAPQEMINNLC